MRTKAMLALTGLLASLLTLVSPGTAQAAESVPDLQWSTGDLGRRTSSMVESPAGTITVPCSITHDNDLVTYDATGQVIQQLDHASTIDGVPNCIDTPAVDKNGHVYGVPYGQLSGGGWASGPNLLAYDGNTLKWKYPARCENGGSTDYVVGADGNIYVETRLSNGDVRLIGLAPELEAGQTQPTVVMDVDIPNDCSIMLRPYKDGIMLHGQQSGLARFYSYAGKFLGQATIGNIWHEQIDDEGRLFVPMDTGASEPKIAMFDPRTGMVEWSYPFHADTWINQLRPLPGGGVVALVRQPVVNGGVPSPTEQETALVVINPLGQKTQEVTLPDTSVAGDYVNTFISVDGNHKVAVVREMYISTGASPSTVPGIYIGVYDIPNDTWSYQEIMKGDLDKQGGPSGYALVWSTKDALTLTGDTLGLMARCTNNCDDYSRKLYAVEVSGIADEYPQGEVLNANNPAQPEPLTYVALGDSFSSGEGVEPFEEYTDEPGYNMCHRSLFAYSYVLARDPGLAPELSTNGFAACSGAETRHIENNWTSADGKNQNEGPQTSDVLNADPDIVTITIGGNDIGFVAFGYACWQSTNSCAIGSSAHNTAVSNINNVLPGNLEAAYEALLTAAPNAEIYVVGYPHLAPVKTASDPMDNRCIYLYNSGPEYDPWDDAEGARDVVDKLNGKISDVIDSVRAEDPDNERLHFVDANGSGSPFAGHEVCSSGDSYFHNINQAAYDGAYALHPNKRGQEAYAELIRAAIGQ